MKISLAKPAVPLKPLKVILETIRERGEYALRRLRELEELRSLRWKCASCGHIKRFTPPASAERALPCPKCNGILFQVGAMAADPDA
jgi:hypothetical protein